MDGDGRRLCLAICVAVANTGEEWLGELSWTKRNVFDDFIAASEWLIANGYTSPAQTCYWRQWRLLVGAYMTQRLIYLLQRCQLWVWWICCGLLNLRLAGLGNLSMVSPKPRGVQALYILSLHNLGLVRPAGHDDYSWPWWPGEHALQFQVAAALQGGSHASSAQYLN